MSEPSGPIPGPIRPPTNDPKTNVLHFALLGCTCAAFLLIVMAEGLWRWLALVPVALGVKPYPNPSSEGVRAVFLLPASGPATAELFDLRGRLIERRSYPNLPPGETAVVLGDAGLEAGIYVVRLRQGGQSASAKAVIVR